MKIAILTCHVPQNYGAVLQAYALQAYLESRNCTVEIIDYSPDIFLKELKLCYVGDARMKRNLILRIIYILYKLPGRITRRFRFSAFRNNCLHITKRRYESYEELCDTPPLADLFICGSDQIWNTRTSIRGFDPAYYLGFVRDPARKISYAASMSVEDPLPRQVIEVVFPWINDLGHISVREKCISQMLQPYIAKPVVHVVDPVFLLSRQAWEELASKARTVRGRYILIYPMGDGANVLENAGFLAEKTGLPIYCITASKRKDRAVAKYYNCSVPMFLQLILNAGYVVTNSFHGTCFSILFGKDFWTCPVRENNHRILSLLRLFGLQRRYVPEGELPDWNEPSVNYADAGELINEAVGSSKDFLENAIRGLRDGDRTPGL